MENWNLYLPNQNTYYPSLIFSSDQNLLPESKYPLKYENNTMDSILKL
jgi:hypothetical protein